MIDEPIPRQGGDVDAGQHMGAMHLARSRHDRHLLGDGLDTPG
jgi:hypothetical protein